LVFSYIIIKHITKGFLSWMYSMMNLRLFVRIAIGLVIC